MPLPAKLLKVPPETVTSLVTKSVATSLSTKVSVAVWPAPTIVLSLVTAIVGGTVSTVIATALLASAPSAFKFPAASENALSATLTTPAVVLLVVGVNVAV